MKMLNSVGSVMHDPEYTPLSGNLHLKIRNKLMSSGYRLAAVCEREQCFFLQTVVGLYLQCFALG